MKGNKVKHGEIIKAGVRHLALLKHKGPGILPGGLQRHNVTTGHYYSNKNIASTERRQYLSETGKRPNVWRKRVDDRLEAGIGAKADLERLQSR